MNRIRGKKTLKEGKFNLLVVFRREDRGGGVGDVGQEVIRTFMWTTMADCQLLHVKRERDLKTHLYPGCLTHRVLFSTKKATDCHISSSAWL